MGQESIYECLLVDTETTGISVKDEVIEFAYISLPELSKLKEISPIYGKEYYNVTARYKPSVDIHPAAEKIHGISKAVLKDCPPSASIQVPAMKYMLGHNVSFDHKMLKTPFCETICTLELARKLWKKEEVGNHKLTNLIEILIPNGKAIVKEAHGALADCYLTLILFDEILKLMPLVTEWEDLTKTESVSSPKASNTSKPISVMPFGKHKGELLCNIPRDYLQWLVKQELQKPLKEAIEQQLFLISKTTSRFN